MYTTLLISIASHLISLCVSVFLCWLIFAYGFLPVADMRVDDLSRLLGCVLSAEGFYEVTFRI